MLNITIYPHRKHCKGNKANTAKGARHHEEQTQKIKSIVLHKNSENTAREYVKGFPNGLFTTINQVCVTVSAFCKQKCPKEAKTPPINLPCKKKKKKHPKISS